MAEKARRKAAAEGFEPKQEKEQAKEGVVVLTTRPREAGDGADRDHRDPARLGKSVVFRMTGAAPIKTKTLLLKDPNRYVVDLQGNWGIQLPRVPKDLWISGIRLGHHEESTRLVFELTRAPVSAKVVKINNTTVEVRIQ
ncbi:MAG: AMIN domain-containing protein [Bilophila wadsworthia]